MESDPKGMEAQKLDVLNFYPRSPHGERRKHVRRVARSTDFYPRSPHGERPFTAKW